MSTSLAVPTLLVPAWALCPEASLCLDVVGQGGVEREGVIQVGQRQARGAGGLGA